MPGPLDLLDADDTPTISARIEPTFGAFSSLVLLAKAGSKPGLDAWVTRTAAAMSAEERWAHALTVNGVYYAIVPRQSWPSFPAYVDDLAALDPEVLRDRLLDAYARIPVTGSAACCTMLDEPAPIDRDAVLASADAYLAFLQERFDPKFVDEKVERAAYTYVIDPPAMQELVVSHLRHMWSRYLAPEWAQVEPLVREAVDALAACGLEQMGKLEAVEWATGRELGDWKEMIEKAEHVVLVPTGHGGKHLWRIGVSGTVWVLFGAEFAIAAAGERVPALNRGEVLVRLGALADANRLHVLELVAERGEQTSQEIIASLGLSQSAVSRHLKQLCAAEFLSERRCGGGKCYALNAGHVRESLQAVSSYLLGS